MSDAMELLYEVKDHCAWLTLNREWRRNALSYEMIELFFTYLDKARDDEAVRVVCVTGAGDKAFCSGADLLGALNEEDPTSGITKYADLLKKLNSYPKPLVAKLNGHCVAGGMGLMLSCDMVYAKEGIKIGTPEVNVGLFPMMIGALIFRNSPRKKAMEMVYHGRIMPVTEAEEMGLVTRILPADSFDEEVDRLIAIIASKSPVANRIGRKAFAQAQEMTLNQALDYLCSKLGEVLKTEDAAEGLAAFMEKREPQWKGK